MVFTTQPTNTTAGVAITPAVTVAIQDASGNVMTSATDAVTIAAATGSGVLFGKTTMNPVNGVATFQDLSIESAGSGYTLVAVAMVSPTLTSAPSSRFSVAPAAASMLLVGSPSPVEAARQFAVAVRVSDAFGSAGGAHTCALTHTGTAYCWGANSSGQVGVGTVIDYASPVIVASSAAAVSAGGSHSCAIATGLLYCWGLNDEGQLGDGSKTTRLSPTAAIVDAAGSVITGGSHTCGSYNSDPWDYGETTICWGSDVQGQLGDLGNTSMFALVAGGSHTCGTDSGPLPALDCWGSNENGQLGVGSSKQFSRTPLRVASFFGNGAASAGAFTHMR